MKLDIALGIQGPEVFMRVLEQDDSTRGKHVLGAAGRTQIMSVSMPQILHMTSYSVNEVYVRGDNREADNITASSNYGTPERAIAFVEEIIMALRSINNDPKYLPKPLVLDLQHVTEA